MSVPAGARGAPTTGRRWSWGAREASIAAGLAASLVVSVNLIRAFRPALLTDPDPSWAFARLVLGLGVVAAGGAAGGLCAAGFLSWTRSRVALSPEAFPLSRRALAAVAVAAFLVGTLLRFVELERVPYALWVDDVSLVGPTLDLRGSPADFADSIRPAPAGVEKPYGTVGVLYLEAERLVLRLFGTTVFGVRFLAAAAGVLSLGTAYLLGRALLPRGGGALALLVLAGLRWHLILSRWGWVAVVLIPIVDAAGLLALRARRARSLTAAAAAGFLAGAGAHVYLAAWVAAAAIFVLLLWSTDCLSGRRARLRLAAFFLAGFLPAVAPLFLLREGRTSPYFARTSDHNVLVEVRRTGSWMPPLSAAADSLVAPWLLPDPIPLNDLPGRTRLGWILGVPVAVALARALYRPRRESSSFLLAHGAAAFAASVSGGQALLPNGFRFAYLTTVCAVAAADGLLGLPRLSPAAGRRTVALCLVGLVAISGALAARDALVVWGESRDTFDYFHGPDTLLARAAIRWGRYGLVEADLSLVHSAITYQAVRKHRLDPQAERWEHPGEETFSGRLFRIVPPGSEARPGERRVERLGDAWGREWGEVLARRETGGGRRKRETK